MKSFLEAVLVAINNPELKNFPINHREMDEGRGGVLTIKLWQKAFRQLVNSLNRNDRGH
jgi:hypothetical protein